MESKQIKSSIKKIKTTLKEAVVLSGSSDGKAAKDKLQKITVDLLVEVMELEQLLNSGAVMTQSQGASRKRSSEDETDEGGSSKKGRRSKSSGRKKKVATKNPVLDMNDPVVAAAEVEKIARRLPVWKQNQSQFNAALLTTYLRLLQNNDADHVTLDELSAQYDDLKKFKLNFNTMRTISKNNNGKVFHMDDEKRIFIWEPVKHLVNEYKEGLI